MSQATVEPVLVDEHGMPRLVGRRAAVLSPNLAAVCRGAHHQMLIPHGRWVLVGNPNQRDGLRLKRLDELTADERAQLGLPAKRAGPTAA
jgi:hypothetical protein